MIQEPHLCASDIRIKLQQLQQQDLAASLDEMVQIAPNTFITGNRRGRPRTRKGRKDVLLFLRLRETFPGMPTQMSRTQAQNTSYFASIKVHFIPKTGIKAFSKALLRLMPVLLLETESKKPVPGRVRWPVRRTGRQCLSGYTIQGSVASQPHHLQKFQEADIPPSHF